MFSITRNLFKSGSSGFHYLCESRYGVTNAPFFSLFPKDRNTDSILSTSTFSAGPSSELMSSTISSSSPSRSNTTNNTGKQQQQNVAGCREGFSMPLNNTTDAEQQAHHNDHHTEDRQLHSLFHPSTHGSVLTLSPTQFKSACCYCRAAIALISKIPNARDFLGGWAAAITSNADLVNCALQTQANPEDIDDFVEEIYTKRSELTEQDRAVIVRCFLIDVVTATVRARGPNDLLGIEDFLNEHEKFEEDSNTHNNNNNNNNNHQNAEGKATEKRDNDDSDRKAKKMNHQFHSYWIDALLTNDLVALTHLRSDGSSTMNTSANCTDDAYSSDNNNSNKDDDSSSSSTLVNDERRKYHVLRPIFKFARDREVPDRIVAEIFSLAIQEVELNEEKFSLIADGSSVTHLH